MPWTNPLGLPNEEFLDNDIPVQCLLVDLRDLDDCLKCLQQLDAITMAM